MLSILSATCEEGLNMDNSSTWHLAECPRKDIFPFWQRFCMNVQALVTLRFLASRVTSTFFIHRAGVAAARSPSNPQGDNGSSTWTMQCYIILYWKKVMPTLHGYIIIRSVPELTIKHPVSQRSYRKYYQYLHLQISVL
jgi:hypothetical protein